LPYLGLVLVLGSMAFLIVNVNQALAGYPLLGFAFGLAEYYLILIAAHLLGRFYWRHSEKLNWTYDGSPLPADFDTASVGVKTFRLG